MRLGDFAPPVQTHVPRPSNIVTHPLSATVQPSISNTVPRYLSFSSFYSALLDTLTGRDSSIGLRCLRKRVTLLYF